MLTPIRHNILVKPFEADSVTTGGILVPENCRERNNKAEVVAVGGGTKKIPMPFRPGQTVFNVQNWGQEIEIEGVSHYLMDQRTILATL
jgi:chaperonin GroES